MEYAIRKTPNSYTYKDQWMKKNGGNLEILVLGSSHTYMGIDPSFFSARAFSLANVSQTLKYDLLLLKKYLPILKGLKYLVLPISYNSFFFDLEKTDEWWRVNSYQIYMGINAHPYSIKYNLEIINLKGVLNKFIHHYLKNKGEMEYTPLGMSTMSTLQKKGKKKWDNGIERVKEHTHSRDEDITKKDSKYLELEGIVNLCKEKNIRLILITTPVWSSYSENVDRKKLNIMLESIKNVKINRNNVYYYDLFTDDRFRPDEDNFYDADHLSDKGARKLTEILNDSIQALENVHPGIQP